MPLRSLPRLGLPRPALTLVRWVRLDEPLPAGGGDRFALGPDEQARMASMHAPGQRDRFRTARWLLRAAVAEVTGGALDVVGVSQRCARCGGPHGRPTVTVGGRPGPAVSLAHGGDLAAVAVAARPVGVDLEPVATDASPEEVGALRSWVRTEAVLKATGHGLDVDPSQIEVRSGPAGPELVRWDGPGRRPALQLGDLAIPGAVAAVARAGRGPIRIDLAAADLTSQLAPPR